jgi:hypothetical protein
LHSADLPDITERPDRISISDDHYELHSHRGMFTFNIQCRIEDLTVDTECGGEEVRVNLREFNDYWCVFQEWADYFWEFCEDYDYELNYEDVEFVNGIEKDWEVDSPEDRNLSWVTLLTSTFEKAQVRASYDGLDTTKIVTITKIWESDSHFLMFENYDDHLLGISDKKALQEWIIPLLGNEQGTMEYLVNNNLVGTPFDETRSMRSRKNIKVKIRVRVNTYIN